MSTKPERLPGTLVLVVGPSGAGKDTLIRAAASALAEDPRFAFPKRSITRPAADATESHDPCTIEQFRQKVRERGYLLRWEAHGLGYGIPAAVRRDLAEARIVVANVSRAILKEACTRFPRSIIVHVTAPPDELARRLERRDRETEDDVKSRLARKSDPFPAGVRVFTVDNGDGVESGAAKFLKAVLAASAESRRPHDGTRAVLRSTIRS